MEEYRNWFWSNVNIGEPNECWNWLATKDRLGYGRVAKRCIGTSIAKTRLAHRIAWFITNGELGKLHVLHRCDNPSCVNPRHLRLGTHQDNMKDMKDKGRVKPGWSGGSINGRAVLDEEKVAVIKEKIRAGQRGVDIAKEFGVSRTVIYFIKRGTHWKHVE